jgi:hypothetical protein
MTPFQVDPSWYERHWWREQPPGRLRAMVGARLIGAAESTGRFLIVAAQFIGYVLFLIVAGDFRLPRCNEELGKRAPIIHEPLQR